MSTIEELREYALNKKSNTIESTTVSHAGIDYGINDLNTLQLNGFLNQAEQENGAGIRSLALPGSSNPVELTNTQLITLLRGASNAMQKLHDIHDDILILIDNLTLTTEAGIDTEWATLTSAYTTNRTITDMSAAGKMVVGTTTKAGAFPYFQSATVSSGNAVFHATVDGTSGTAALFPNGADLSTILFRAVESASLHGFGTPALSNSNKTITVPVIKTTAVTVLGISVLAATAAANGSVVNMMIWGN